MLMLNLCMSKTHCNSQCPPQSSRISILYHSVRAPMNSIHVMVQPLESYSVRSYNSRHQYIVLPVKLLNGVASCRVAHLLPSDLYIKDLLLLCSFIFSLLRGKYERFAWLLQSSLTYLPSTMPRHRHTRTQSQRR